MLFPYKYLENHPIEKLQEYLDFLVLEVWCEAEGEFEIEMLDQCKDLQGIIEDVFNDNRINKDHLYGPISSILKLFQELDAATRNKIREVYQFNNDIEGLCCGVAKKTPITYATLKQTQARIAPDEKTTAEKLADELSHFYKALFTDIIHLKAVQERIGSISDHYEAFVQLNDEDICPFCGISALKDQYQTPYRDAYDHYLPKHIYPFNSVNFRNLAPMCHDCNSTYKGIKEPIYEPSPKKSPIGEREDQRRKAFYPYAEELPPMEIRVTLKTNDVNSLTPEQVELVIKSPGHEEEVAAWLDVFGIDKRYKSSFCRKNDVKYWVIQLLDETIELHHPEERKGQIDDALKKLERRAKRFPWADKNFLKWPFAYACQEAGIL